MTLSHIIKDEILIISLPEGRLDASSAPITKTKILELISSFQRSQVILNLEKVSFIDSVGISTLILIGKELKDKGELKISSPQKAVRVMLEMVRLHKIFEIFPSDAEALRSWNHA